MKSSASQCQQLNALESAKSNDSVTKGGDQLIGLTTASFVPQVRKIWKTKSAADVSLLMFVAFCVGVTLWLVYGFSKGEVAIIVTSAVTLVLGAAIVWMKLKFSYMLSFLIRIIT